MRTQTKLAVITCKAQKELYECPAEKMYRSSYVFRTQLAFIKKYYDAYVILSAKYGVIFPDQIIKPYSIILHTSGTTKALAKNKAYMMSREETAEWAKRVIVHPIFTQYDHIDFHLTNAYWNPIKKCIPNICKSWNRVSFPQSLITTGHRYEKLLGDLEAGRPIDLSIMGKKIISKFPEKKRWYYHQHYKPFFGWARGLVKEYPQQELDEGALVRVDKMSITGDRYSHAGYHHKGWCCSKQTLKHLYRNEKGMWRYNGPQLEKLPNNRHKSSIIGF
jgi:hypothetical protein